MALVLDRTSPDLLYTQIQSWMRGQITSGSWPEHFKLTAESDLAEELGVNRGTLRKATEGLIEEGLLVRIHGRGTFVASRRLEQPLAERFVTFSEDLKERGIPYQTSVLEQTVIRPNKVTASLLKLPNKAKAFYLKRVRFVEKKPVILLHNYVALTYCKGIEKVDFTELSLFDVLEQHYQLIIDWAQRSFEARVADEAVARQLGLKRGDAVMYVQQVSYLEDGTPIELSDLWIRADHFRLSAQDKRNRPLPLKELFIPKEV